MPAILPDAPGLKFTAKSRWENWHKTVKQETVGIYDVYNDIDVATATVAGLKRTTGRIQRVIREVKGRGLRLRALGSGWSLSRAATTDGVILNTANLNWALPIRAAAFHPEFAGPSVSGGSFHFIQCGKSVAEVNAYLEAQGQSLRTSGAANGQTFLGAASTGTHGSALEFGAIQDHIHGIHLIAGDSRHYWLEHSARPVMADGFATQLGAELRRHEQHDDLFRAALVSLGGLGVVQGVAIQAVPRFLLEVTNTIRPLDGQLRHLIETLDFGAHPDIAPKGQPYFLQIVLNPHQVPAEAYLTMMYQLPCPADHKPKYGLTGGIKPGYDILSLVGGITDAAPKVTPILVARAAKLLMEVGSKKPGTWGEIFNYKSPQAKVQSGSICVPLERAGAALDVLIALIRSSTAVPLVFGCRFVRKSPALLAFTRYPISCVINIDGVDSKRSDAFLASAADRIEAAGIPFTQHWGKALAYTPERLRKAFGTDLDDWLEARAALLDPADRALFSSPFMEELGLAN